MGDALPRSLIPYARIEMYKHTIAPIMNNSCVGK